LTEYHMQKAEREITSKDEKMDIIANGKFATLALSRGDRPYAVTLNYGFDKAEQALYFHCALKGLKNEMIRSNPRVCATIVEDLGYKMDQCSHAYRSLIINGSIRRVQEYQDKAHGLKVIMDHLEEDPGRLKDRYLTDEDEEKLDGVAIFRLDIEEITGKEGK